MLISEKSGKQDLKEEENKTLDLTRDTLLITLIMNPENLV